MFDIMHLVRIHASPARVYGAITTAEGIRNWWIRDATLESEIGGTGEFRFNEHHVVSAVAHSILVIDCHVLSDGQPCRELGGGYFERLNADRLT